MRVLSPAQLVFLMLAAAAHADDGAAAVPAAVTVAPGGPGGTVVVRAGLYLLNVGRFEIATGTYTADFYLTLRSDRDMGDPRFEFMNGRAATMDVLDDTPTYKQYRVQANLMAGRAPSAHYPRERDPPEAGPHVRNRHPAGPARPGRYLRGL